MPVHAASLADLADLVPLFSAYLDFYEVPAPEEQVRAFLAERLRQGDSTLFLARDAEARALGFVQLYPLFASHGGNWLESRMSRMAGQFAGILRVAVPAEGYDELVEGLQGLSSHGIRVLLAESGIEPVCNWKPIHLDLVGNDRPGIVRDITRLLAEHGVNLESLSTEVRPAPMSSEPLFHADALLAVPLTLSLDTLRERLEDLADDLMVELVLDAS